jgi:hypothetical protein
MRSSFETWGEYMKWLRAKAAAVGLCSRCRQYKPPSGFKTCGACRDLANKTKANNKAAGLCACGQKPSPGRKNCDVCLEGASLRNKLKTALHIHQGICIFRGCDSPAQPGRRMCDLHLKVNAANVAAYARRKRLAATGVDTP